MNNPPAGWYDNPEGAGQRYWDGTTWTDQFQQEMDTHRARPNEYAVLWAALFGVISLVGLLVVLSPRMGGSSAYGAGQLAVPAALAAAVVVLVARSTSRHFAWWVYALAVPVTATVLVLVFVVVSDLRESVEEAASPEEPVDVLSVPSAGDGWTVVDTARTRAEVRRVTEGMANEPGGDVDSVVAGLYTHRSAPGTRVLFIGFNGELDQGSSADQDLVNILAGAGVDDPQDFDSGDVGGALGCGVAANQGLEWVSCAWASNERTVLVQWGDKSVGLEQAAELTIDLRDRSSH